MNRAFTRIALLAGLAISLSACRPNSSGGPAGGPGIPGVLPSPPALNALSRASFAGVQPQPNSWSSQPRASFDGRYICFYSYASNLIASDTNGNPDVFVRDTLLNKTVLVSRATGGAQGNSSSYYGSISDDGRYIAFLSYSNNLADDDGDGNFDDDQNNSGDIFVHDRDADGDTFFDDADTPDDPNTTMVDETIIRTRTIRISRNDLGDEANSSCDYPDISGDGMTVAFVSYASNLDPLAGGFTGNSSIFVHQRDVDGSLGPGLPDTLTNFRTFLVSVSTTGTYPNSYCWSPSISADGNVVAFYAYASNLVAGDFNGWEDVFVRVINTNTTQRVSVDTLGQDSNLYSFLDGNALSANGRFVVFYSYASDLVINDTNGVPDVFMRDRLNNTTTRISMAPGGIQANNSSFYNSISDDGARVAFISYANNLVSGDTNNTYDVFVWQGGAVTRASIADTTGAQCDNYSFYPSLSGDGQVVTFETYGTNLAPPDTNNQQDIYARTTTDTIRISVGGSTEPNGESVSARVSADGNLVVFESDASEIVAGDTNGVRDIFIRDVATSANVRVTQDSNGNQANGFSGNPTISEDGAVVAFLSNANNLVPSDSNGVLDVFVRNLFGTTRASVSTAGAQATGPSTSAMISANGKFVVFTCTAGNLVAGDLNGVADVFIRDLVNNTTTLVSCDSAGVIGNAFSANPSVSKDGRYVAFLSQATNLDPNDTDSAFDVFVKDLQTGTLTLVSVDSGGVKGDADSMFPSISGDGQIVAFESQATNLVAGDLNGVNDVFTHSMTTGVTRLISISLAAAPGNGESRSASISSDGKFVVFESSAGDLVSDDTNNLRDIFRFRLSNSEMLRVSVSADPLLPDTNNDSFNPGISADGRFVTFQSYASNMSNPAETAGLQDVYRAGPLP